MKHNIPVELFNAMSSFVRENNSASVCSENLVIIIGIICLTFIIITAIIALCIYTSRRSNMELHKEIDELKGKVNALENRKSEYVPDKQKFIDFCYEMAKSADEKNTSIKEESWEILKNEFKSQNPDVN